MGGTIEFIIIKGGGEKKKKKKKKGGKKRRKEVMMKRRMRKGWKSGMKRSALRKIEGVKMGSVHLWCKSLEEEEGGQMRRRRDNDAGRWGKEREERKERSNRSLFIAHSPRKLKI